MSKIKILFPIIVLFAIGSILLMPQNDNRLSYAPNLAYANEAVTSAYPVGDSASVTNGSSSAYPVGEVAKEDATSQISPASIEAYPIDPNEIEQESNEVSVTIQFTTTYTPVYLPIILDRSNSIKNGTTKFSIAGAIGGIETRTDNTSPVTNTIPFKYATDGYSWGSTKVDSSVRMIRTCSSYRFAFSNSGNYTIRPYYQERSINKLCWDHVTGIIMRVVPYNTTINGETICDLPNGRIEITLSDNTKLDLHDEPCLTAKGYRYYKNNNQIDTEITPVDDFKQIVATHPDVVWLIGNETDNKHQDRLTDQILYEEEKATGITTTNQTRTRLLDGFTISEDSEIPDGDLIGDSGPEIYAQFYKYMYNLIQTATPTGHEAKLVFCQATFANDQLSGQGLTYCRNAYDALEHLMGTNAPNSIYALAVHEYLNKGDLENEQANFLSDSNLKNNVNEHWIDPLHAFECWSGDEEACKAINTNVADFEGEPALARKPLWLTEFGSLSASDPIRGDGYLHLGENENEGLWGLQMAQHDYLYNSKRWQKAWWYVSLSDEVCDKPENAPSEIKWCIRNWVDEWTTDTITNSIPTFPQLTTELTSITQTGVTTYTKCSGTGIWSFQYKYTLNGTMGETPIYPCRPRLPFVGMPSNYYNLTNLITGTNTSNTIAITSTVSNNALGERLAYSVRCIASERTNCPIDLTTRANVFPKSQFIPYDPPSSVCKPTNDNQYCSIYDEPPVPSLTVQNNSCHIKYSVEQQWESDTTNGFTGKVALTNQSNTPITGWEVHWAYFDGQEITSSWHSKHAYDPQQTLPISITNATWNKTIAPAQTVDFGFNASWSGENSAPTMITLNDTACQLTIDIPNPPPPPLPPEQIGCTVTYNIVNDWGTGFTADIFIQNDDSVHPIEEWELTWTFPDDQFITNLWEGIDTQIEHDVAVEDDGWNKVIEPNDTVKFGFSSVYQTDNTPPDMFYLNETACNVIIQ